MEKEKTRKKTNMGRPNRKPDFETESLRSWVVSEDDAKALNEDDENFFDVECDGVRVRLGGFTMLRDKASREVRFAFKVKRETRSILWYLKDESDEPSLKVLDGLRKVAKDMGYSLVDARDALKNIASQKHVWDKLARRNGNAREKKSENSGDRSSEKSRR